MIEELKELLKARQAVMKDCSEAQTMLWEANSRKNKLEVEAVRFALKNDYPEIIKIDWGKVNRIVRPPRERR